MTGKFPRGLAHPFTFNGVAPSELLGRTPGIPKTDPTMFNRNFELFGAVLVNPFNYYRLLQTGQDVLLFPGGSREAITTRKDYPLYWPEKVDFVRTAARFNATIVPFSAIGMVDSIHGIAELEDAYQLPLIGDLARWGSTNTRSARYDQKHLNETIGLPLFAPSLPARNYFLFGQPIYTDQLDPKDKVACEEVYRQAEATVRSGLDDLLRAREQDPFQNTIQRLAYERLWGKKAPTFSIDVLNKNRR